MWSLEWDWVEENEGVLQRTGLPSLICCMAGPSESEISFFCRYCMSQLICNFINKISESRYGLDLSRRREVFFTRNPIVRPIN